MKMKFSTATIVTLFFGATSASVVNLTPDNYQRETDGKYVFIKFFSPG